MAVVDRTDDFFKAASAQVSAGVRPLSTFPIHGKRTPSEEAKKFTEKAAEISKKIHLASRRLQRLAELTRSQGVFDDPGEEINTIAVRLQSDTKFIKIELDHLQEYLNSNKRQVGHGSANASMHSQTVVETMRLQLRDTAKSFKTVLEERQNSMKAKTDRRGLYGTSRTPQQTFGQQRHNSNGSATGAPSSADTLPRPSGVQSTQAGQPDLLMGGNGSYEEDEEPMPLIQHNSVMQDNRYFSSRAEAMTSIESHIVELGGVFQQLSQLIVEQGNLAERINRNVDESHENLNYGHEQLMQTWNNMSGNKWLMAKIAFVLLFFMTFFVAFLA